MNDLVPRTHATSPAAPRGEPAAPNPWKPQLDALTGVRFVAALAVVVFHCTPWRTWGGPAPLRNVAGSGFVAVGFFFVLSGFILAYAHDNDRAPTPRRTFYVSRFARIYPVYATGLLLMVPFFLVAHARAHDYGRLAFEAITVATLVQAYVPSVALAWNPPSWSLSVEATFYALFPLVAPGLFRLSRRGAVVVAIACCGVALSLPLAYLALLPDGEWPTSKTDAFFMDALKFSPPARLPEFVLGVALGRLHRDAAFRGLAARWAPWLAPAVVVAMLATLAMGDAVPYPLLHNGLLAPAFAVVIVTLATGRGALARVLGSRPAVKLGEASYALYILHLPLIIVMRKVTDATVGKDFADSRVFLALYFGLAIGASLASYSFIELPLRGRLRRALLRGRESALGGLRT